MTMTSENLKDSKFNIKRELMEDPDNNSDKQRNLLHLRTTSLFLTQTTIRTLSTNQENSRISMVEAISKGKMAV